MLSQLAQFASAGENEVLDDLLFFQCLPRLGPHAEVVKICQKGATGPKAISALKDADLGSFATQVEDVLDIPELQIRLERFTNSAMASREFISCIGDLNGKALVLCMDDS